MNSSLLNFNTQFDTLTACKNMRNMSMNHININTSVNVDMNMNMNMNMNHSMANGSIMTGQQQQQQIQNAPSPISYTMMELYDCVQYCPNVLSRLYLQICAASALIRSGEVGARWVFKDLIEAVKCVQNPVRGLFLRHYLLQAFRDKLPDVGIPMDQIGNLIRGTEGAPPPAAPTGENAIPLENVSVPALELSTASLVDHADPGTVKDSYEFVLANFIEMNKLWVRIQHLPGDQRTKEVRRRREKDRNELRILVGTNLVRLSALDSVTSTIYGQVILPTVLDQIVICADPLSQAYLIDCIVQVFPDEYHIETMPILLGVCPKLRDKVNIRTILISLMTRLANYLAEEELLDEKDSNQVKMAVALDSFQMFDECVQNVYNARGPKLNAKEVIRLQTAMLEFSMKCYKGNIEQITLCLKNCVLALQQARDNAAFLLPPPPPQPQQYGIPQAPSQLPPPPPTALEAVATKELEKLLSIPLEELALGVLTLDHYADLIAFLPWSNRREVALNLLRSATNAGKPPESVKEIEELFSVIAPVLRGERDASPSPGAFSNGSNGVDHTANLMAGLGVTPDPSYASPPHQQQQQQQQQQYMTQQGGFNSVVDPLQHQQDSALVSKFIGMLDNPDTDVLFEMLSVARNHMNAGKSATQRASTAHAALVFAALKLARRVFKDEHKEKQEEGTDANAETEENDVTEEIVEAAGTDTKDEGEIKVESKEVAKPSAVEDQEDAKPAAVEDEEDTKPAAVEVEEDAKPAAMEVEDTKLAAVEVEEDAKPAAVEVEDTKPAAVEVEDTKPAAVTAAEVQMLVTCRKVFVFIQQTIAYFAQSSPERGIKLYLEAALTADKLGASLEGDDSKDERETYGSIASELFAQSCALYEQHAMVDARLQRPCVLSFIRMLTACRSLGKEDYEGLIMKTSKYAAKMVKKNEQCEMVTLCSHLFYVMADDGTTVVYANPQRCLECLQRALKLANACTTANPSNLGLFVELLDIYLFFFEKKNPSITGNYITGLVALIKEHTKNVPQQQYGGGPSPVAEAKAHFLQTVRHIKAMKQKPESSQMLQSIDVSAVET